MSDFLERVKEWARQSGEEEFDFVEHVESNGKRYLVSWKEYQFCDECMFFPSSKSKKWAQNWAQDPPLCKLHLPMIFLEPDTDTDALNGNFGYTPVDFVCEEFEKKIIKSYSRNKK